MGLPACEFSPELCFDEHPFCAALIYSNQIWTCPVRRAGLRAHLDDRFHIPDTGPNHVIKSFPGAGVLVQNVAERLDGDILRLRRKRRGQMSQQRIDFSHTSAPSQGLPIGGQGHAHPGPPGHPRSTVDSATAHQLYRGGPVARRLAGRRCVGHHGVERTTLGGRPGGGTLPHHPSPAPPGRPRPRSRRRKTATTSRRSAGWAPPRRQDRPAAQVRAVSAATGPPPAGRGVLPASPTQSSPAGPGSVRTSMPSARRLSRTGRSG